MADVEKIEKLVSEHDACFLVFDSREARWLPTLLAALHNKICISVGLGFDSYVIIRHGMSPLVHDPAEDPERSGCFFCNDYLAPSNTMSDRTLDQQCTVTRYTSPKLKNNRPGLSYVSSGFAVELLVNLVSHPLRNRAPGYHADEIPTHKGKPIEISPEADMGIVPQHIRGSVGYFETKTMQSSAFDYCLACSKPIVEDFVKDKRGMITRA